MVVRFLGTGTSTGVPEIGCRCEVCTSSDKRDHRLRASVQIDVDGKNIIIDCTPDFRQQILNLPFRKIDGMLITHEHYDHTGGIDDLRPFGRFGTVNLYVEPDVARALGMRMPYCFVGNKYRGVPDITLREIVNLSPFFIDEVEVVPIRIIHYKMPILGYRIGNFAYLTDVKYVPEEEILKLKGVDTLVLSALRKKEHLSHENLDEAIALSRKINPRITYFTHMSHQIGLHSVIEKQLPPNMLFAYDGLEITV
jgi:phosphoribosyl 1,2-cyclic phosphate phosphodiesterase